MSDEKLEELLGLVPRIVKFVAREFPGVSREDLEQEVYVFVVENAKTLRVIAEGGNPSWIIRTTARRLASKMRIEDMYGSCQYNYTPKMVRRLLELRYSPEEWEGIGIPKEDASLARHGDGIIMQADLSEALERATESVKRTLFVRYGLGEVPDNGSATRRRVDRGIESITHSMNHYSGRGLPKRKKRVDD